MNVTLRTSVLNPPATTQLFGHRKLSYTLTVLRSSFQRGDFLSPPVCRCCPQNTWYSAERSAYVQINEKTFGRGVKGTS